VVVSHEAVLVPTVIPPKIVNGPVFVCAVAPVFIGAETFPTGG